MPFSRLVHHLLGVALTIGAILFTIALRTSTAQAPVPIEQRIQRIQDAILTAVLVKGELPAATKLADRMAALHLPGVSIAVIHDGKIEWRAGSV
jgi:CubicO group peptidase (beta-lactamase class C family)